MRFELTHEIDAPIDAIELAFLSPEMGAMLARALSPSIASVETTLHRLEGRELTRILRFQASAPLTLFKGRTIAADALVWETTVTYQIGGHTSTWEVSPREQYRKYFRAKGTSRLAPAPEGRTLRTVSGDLEVTVPVPMLGGIVERVALVEVRKTYDAEAETLRKLATL